MNNNHIIEVENLVKKFGSFVANDHLNFFVRKGEIFGFLGANGAGKTTLIRMLCGLLMPSSGTATIAGFDIYKQSEHIKQNIGYMSQKFSLYDDLTIGENIEFYGGIYYLSDQKIAERREALLGELNLHNLADSMTRDLPMGFKQRLALGCAMLRDPPVLFLDEPTSGVDPKARRSFWNLIYETSAKGKTIFVTTHFMDEAEYCHRLSIMRDGQVIALASPGELKEKYNKKTMQDVFIRIARSETN